GIGDKGNGLQGAQWFTIDLDTEIKLLPVEDVITVVETATNPDVGVEEAIDVGQDKLIFAKDFICAGGIVRKTKSEIKTGIGVCSAAIWVNDLSLISDSARRISTAFLWDAYCCLRKRNSRLALPLVGK